MKKTVLTALAAATALATFGGAAVAQPYGYDRQDRYERQDRYDRGDRGDWRSGNQIERRFAEIRQRIDWADRRGLLDRAERYKVTRGYDDLARRNAQFRVGGYNSYERNEINRRLDLLEAALDTRVNNGGYAWRR
ncbi:MAG: hypothetical protein DI570_15485 [Phenylobacterium zucineum]|nr:MAG: hypothetical protein DI570_15485 [Phenylobacterium zucineum]